MTDQEFKVCKTICWEIPNFTRQFAEQHAIGQRINSKKVTLSYDDNVTTWFLRFYPNGKTTESIGFLGLFLCNDSLITTSFNTKISFGILTNSGEVCIRKCSERSGEEFVVMKGRGFTKYVSHDDHFATISTLTSNNTLMIQCKMSIYAPKVAPAIAQRSDRHESLISDYEKLFASGVQVDFSMIMNDGETLKAHKTILIARSPVFFRMLTIDMEEATKNSVNIPDIDSKTMKELLRFVYCDKVENLDGVATSLIYAAEKYDIAELKEICYYHVMFNLSQENVVEALIVADRITGMKKLFDKCVSFIALHHDSVFKTAEWKELQADLLRRVTEEIIYRNNGVVYV